MTLEEAREAGRLVGALGKLDREASSLVEQMTATTLVFDENMNLPPAVMKAMLDAGAEFVRSRLRAIGVEA